MMNTAILHVIFKDQIDPHLIRDLQARMGVNTVQVSHAQSNGTSTVYRFTITYTVELELNLIIDTIRSYGGVMIYQISKMGKKRINSFKQLFSKPNLRFEIKSKEKKKTEPDMLKEKQKSGVSIQEIHFDEFMKFTRENRKRDRAYLILGIVASAFFFTVGYFLGKH